MNSSVDEFKHYGLPDWLRDFVGILKLTFALLLVVGIGRPLLAVVGGIGIAVLMAAAVATHLRVKNPLHKLLPSAGLLVLTLLLAWMNRGAMAG